MEVVSYDKNGKILIEGLFLSNKHKEQEISYKEMMDEYNSSVEELNRLIQSSIVKNKIKIFMNPYPPLYYIDKRNYMVMTCGYVSEPFQTLKLEYEIGISETTIMSTIWDLVNTVNGNCRYLEYGIYYTDNNRRSVAILMYLNPKYGLKDLYTPNKKNKIKISMAESRQMIDSYYGKVLTLVAKNPLFNKMYPSANFDRNILYMDNRVFKQFTGFFFNEDFTDLGITSYSAGLHLMYLVEEELLNDTSLSVDILCNRNNYIALFLATKPGVTVVS